MVEGYFERHPEQRGTGLERLAKARLEMIAARVRASGGRPREALARTGRAFALDPRSVAYEVVQALPAVWGRLKYSKGSRPLSVPAPTRHS